MDVRSARLLEKGIAAGADTFCPPATSAPAPSSPAAEPRCGRRRLLSSAHLPGGLGCCPHGPRLRLSPPFLPSHLLGPSNFPECPPGPQGRGRGGPAAEGGEDWAGGCRRLGPRPGRPGPSDAQGAPAAAGSEWVWPAREGGPGRHLLRAGARAGARHARTLPTAVSHFLGILPLVFISLRRKLGFKKKKKKKKKRKNNHSSI